MLHEMGHTMGLRHNFSGSADALNYGKDYWNLRKLTLRNGDQRPLPEWEINASTDPNILDGYQLALEGTDAAVGGIRDLQNSSVMDYATTYGTNLNIGSYDLAAIKYSYGDLVETFNSPDITPERAKLLQAGEVHYLFYPEVISNAANYDDRITAMYDRSSINFRNITTQVEVPYFFCSDEYNGKSATCSTWDAGADNYERSQYAIDNYNNYFVFNAFKRERLTFGVDIFAYMSRVYSRNFTYMLNQYKNWVDDELIIRSGRPCQVVENGNITVSATDRFSADACGLAGLLGSEEVLNLFGKVMQSPDTGCYIRLKPGCYDTTDQNQDYVADADISLVSSDPNACDTFVPTQPPPGNNVSARIGLKITSSTPYFHVRDSTSCLGYVSLAPALEETPVELGLGNGARPAETVYDRNRYGYYFYDKPTVIGSWWEKWMVVKALGDSNTDFIGVDASSDTRAFLISLNTLFGNDINNLVGGVIADETSAYGPRLDPNGTLSFHEVLDVSGTNLPNDTRPLLNPSQSYTLRLLSMFNAAYQGQSTDQYDFGESLNVGHALAVTDIAIPDDVRSDPTRYAELVDPATGVHWYALNQQRSGATDLYSIGYQFIRQIKSKYYEGGADGPGTTFLPAFQASDFSPRSDIRILNIMQSTTNVFGYSSVWSADPQF
jgi:hypothetical protein